MKNDAIELNQDIVAEKMYKLESEITKQATQIEQMNQKIVQLETELNVNKIQIETNEIGAKNEREKLIEEIEQYRSMIELMNAQIDRLEKSSFQMIDDGHLISSSNSDSILKSQTNDDLLAKLATYEKYFTENMNDSTILKENNTKSLGKSEKSVDRMELHEQMLAENVVASNTANIPIHENGTQTRNLSFPNNILCTLADAQKKAEEQITATEYNVMVKQLKDEISKLLAENMELNDMVSV